ncbi:MAG: hypothetical protein IJC11_02770 [Alphaproteobacteria bacterium]|nr:hypothetical protein [Alphaproteobacteria bacterium]
MKYIESTNKCYDSDGGYTENYCDAGEIWNGSACVANSCSTTEDCPGTYYCDITDGQCIKDWECENPHALDISETDCIACANRVWSQAGKCAACPSNQIRLDTGLCGCAAGTYWNGTTCGDVQQYCIANMKDYGTENYEVSINGVITYTGNMTVANDLDISGCDLNVVGTLTVNSNKTLKVNNITAEGTNTRGIDNNGTIIANGDILGTCAEYDGIGNFGTIETIGNVTGISETGTGIYSNSSAIIIAKNVTGISTEGIGIYYNGTIEATIVEGRSTSSNGIDNNGTIVVKTITGTSIEYNGIGNRGTISATDISGTSQNRYGIDNYGVIDVEGDVIGIGENRYGIYNHEYSVIEAKNIYYCKTIRNHGYGQIIGQLSCRCEDLTLCTEDLTQCGVPTPVLYGNTCKSCVEADSTKPYWTGFACVSECPNDKPASDANNICQTCADIDSSTPIWDSKNQECVACAEGTEWNGEVCSVSCPNDTPYWNGTECVACAMVDVSKPVWDSENKICKACTTVDSTKPYWDADNQKCVTTCPNDKPAPNLDNVCKACPVQSPIWNGTACVTCETIDSDTHWDGSSCVDTETFCTNAMEGSCYNMDDNSSCNYDYSNGTITIENQDVVLLEDFSPCNIVVNNGAVGAVELHVKNLTVNNGSENARKDWGLIWAATAYGDYSSLVVKENLTVTGFNHGIYGLGQVIDVGGDITVTTTAKSMQNEYDSLGEICALCGSTEIHARNITAISQGLYGYGIAAGFISATGTVHGTGGMEGISSPAIMANQITYCNQISVDSVIGEVSCDCSNSTEPDLTCGDDSIESNSTCQDYDLYWDGSTCVSSCSLDKPIVDEENKICTACETGTYWNGTTCVSSCPSGTSLVGNTCVSPEESVCANHMLNAGYDSNTFMVEGNTIKYGGYIFSDLDLSGCNLEAEGITNYATLTVDNITGASFDNLGTIHVNGDITVSSFSFTDGGYGTAENLYTTDGIIIEGGTLEIREDVVNISGGIYTYMGGSIYAGGDIIAEDDGLYNTGTIEATNLIVNNESDVYSYELTNRCINNEGTIEVTGDVICQTPVDWEGFYSSGKVTAQDIYVCPTISIGTYNISGGIKCADGCVCDCLVDSTICTGDTPICDTTNKICVACPSETPYWNGTKCVACAMVDVSKPYWNGSSCEACSDGTVWNSTECISLKEYCTAKMSGYDSSTYTVSDDGVITYAGEMVIAEDLDISGCDLVVNDTTLEELTPVLTINENVELRVKNLTVTGSSGDGDAIYNYGTVIAFGNVSGSIESAGTQSSSGGIFNANTGSMFVSGDISGSGNTNGINNNGTMKAVSIDGYSSTSGIGLRNSGEIAATTVSGTNTKQGEIDVTYVGLNNLSTGIINATNIYYCKKISNSGKITGTISCNCADSTQCGTAPTACLALTPILSGDLTTCVSCATVDSTTPLWDAENQKCVACAEGTEWNGEVCSVPCPNDTPYWNGTECVACAMVDVSKPYWNGSSCEACSDGTVWNSTECISLKEYCTAKMSGYDSANYAVSDDGVITYTGGDMTVASDLDISNCDLVVAGTLTISNNMTLKVNNVTATASSGNGININTNATIIAIDVNSSGMGIGAEGINNKGVLNATDITASGTPAGAGISNTGTMTIENEIFGTGGVGGITNSGNLTAMQVKGIIVDQSGVSDLGGVINSGTIKALTVIGESDRSTKVPGGPTKLGIVNNSLGLIEATTVSYCLEITNSGKIIGNISCNCEDTTQCGTVPTTCLAPTPILSGDLTTCVSCETADSTKPVWNETTCVAWESICTQVMINNGFSSDSFTVEGSTIIYNGDMTANQNLDFYVDDVGEAKCNLNVQGTIDLQGGTLQSLSGTISATSLTDVGIKNARFENISGTISGTGLIMGMNNITVSSSNVDVIAKATTTENTGIGMKNCVFTSGEYSIDAFGSLTGIVDTSLYEATISDKGISGVNNGTNESISGLTMNNVISTNANSYVYYCKSYENVQLDGMLIDTGATAFKCASGCTCSN